MECRNELCGACGRADVEIANHWHPSLLRARDERPSSSSAAKRDNEFSPSDADCHVTLPPEAVSIGVGPYHACRKDEQCFCGAAHVSDGSKTDVSPLAWQTGSSYEPSKDDFHHLRQQVRIMPDEVRSAVLNGHSACTAACSLCADFVAEVG